MRGNMMMTRIEALVFSLLFCTSTRAEVKSNYFEAELEFDNKFFQNSFLTENTATSPTACSVMCSESRKNCGCFGFNPRVKKCRLHETCNTEQTVVYEEGWRNYCPDDLHIPRDCSVILQNGQTESGVYKIYPFSTRCNGIDVYCDMETAGGGWTAFQRRLHWSVGFNRTWEDYKIGFGLPEVAYWIGNDVIHLLTKENNFSLCVVIKLQNGTTLYELYDQFSIDDEANKYKLFLGRPATGTLGDSMLDPDVMNLNGMYFSTLDRDHDAYPPYHCGRGLGGGWWYSYCAHAFLNGPWSAGNFSGSWYPKLPAGSKVKETSMMIKPR